MRLRNRMVKAEFYTDPELLSWPRNKRDLYRSLWALAEDSYCVEDSPFGWKLNAWPSPLDDDMTVESFTVFRDELIEDGKLLPYESGGKRYFFIPDMARHEHPRNPQPPNLPLPEFITWVQNTKDTRKGSYQIDWDTVQRLYNGYTSVVQPPQVSQVTPIPELYSPLVSCLDDPRPSDEEDDKKGMYFTFFKVWERVIGAVPSEASKRTMRAWAEMGYSADAVEEALRKTKESSAKSPARYATSILRSDNARERTVTPDGVSIESLRAYDNA